MSTSIVRSGSLNHTLSGILLTSHLSRLCYEAEAREVKVFGVGVGGRVGGGGVGSSEIIQAMQMSQSSLYASQGFCGGGSISGNSGLRGGFRGGFGGGLGVRGGTCGYYKRHHHLNSSA